VEIAAAQQLLRPGASLSSRPNGAAQKPRADGVSDPRHDRERLRTAPHPALTLGIAFHKAIIAVCAQFEEELGVAKTREPPDRDALIRAGARQ
jgi:hypothetical protein